MGFDSACDTELVLGLSLITSSPPIVKVNMMDSDTMQSFEPSLTLSLSGNHCDQNKNRAVAGCVSDISGGCLSFSNAIVKREREVGSEESNDNNTNISVASVGDVEDDEGCVNGRKKLRLTKPQFALLEEAFKHHNSLNLKKKHELARKLKLRPRQIEVWFQNRRARTKLKKTEMDFQHLKKLCDKLTFENRKLEKELHELKALKSSQPFYMSGTSLAMCPSCERIRDTKSSVVKSRFCWR